jgi:hypothetical protein
MCPGVPNHCRVGRVGSPSQPFSTLRVIRQGDPLSHFLFVIMVEGLGCYIRASTQNGSLKGLPLHRLQSGASHSQFVDDTLIMNAPTMQEEIKLISILSHFNESSGTTFNLAKLGLFFFNTLVEIQHHLSQIMNTPFCTLPFLYLGLPLYDSETRNIS